MHLTRVTKVLVGYYIFVVIFWALLQFLRTQDIPNFDTYNYLYQFAFGLIPLVGGICGIRTAKSWGYAKSKVGATLLFISLGLITWGCGQMLWSLYYNLFLKVEIPYPSLADVGYIISWPLWAIGMVNLSNATGARFSLKGFQGKLIFFLVPLALIVLSYYLLIIVARGGVVTDLSSGYVKVFFDLGYPVGDVIILSLATLIYGLSFSYLGGIFKLPIIILLLGFVINYIVDFSFSYTTTTGTYYNGHWVDLLFPTAMMLIAFGVNSFVVKESPSV